MKYAVIAACGKQYKVSEGDVIKVETVSYTHLTLPTNSRV